MNRLLLLPITAHFSASQTQNQPVRSVRRLESAGAAGAGVALSDHHFNAALLLFFLFVTRLTGCQTQTFSRVS